MASTSAQATTSGSGVAPTAAQLEAEAAIPQLGVLDEDDEFEEFETQDWNDADTALAHLSRKAVSISGQQSSAAHSNGSDGSAGAAGAPGSGVGLSMAGGATIGGAAALGAAGAAAGGAARQAGGKGPADHLWQDNWDDDDIEDDFSKALRAELDKSSVNAAMAT